MGGAGLRLLVRYRTPTMPKPAPRREAMKAGMFADWEEEEEGADIVLRERV